MKKVQVDIAPGQNAVIRGDDMSVTSGSGINRNVLEHVTEVVVGVADLPPEPWRVGELWSADDPAEKIKVIAEGEHAIADLEIHPNFIRWLTDTSFT